MGMLYTILLKSFMLIQNHIKMRGQKYINRSWWWIDPCIWMEWADRRYGWKCRKILYQKPFLVQQMHSLDDLRYNVYHDKKFEFGLEKFPATSESMKLHIWCAYFQAYFWKHASFVDQISLIPEEYGNLEDEIGQLRPLIVSASNFQMISCAMKLFKMY